MDSFRRSRGQVCASGTHSLRTVAHIADVPELAREALQRGRFT